MVTMEREIRRRGRYVGGKSRRGGGRRGIKEGGQPVKVRDRSRGAGMRGKFGGREGIKGMVGEKDKEKGESMKNKDGKKGR